MKKENSKTRYIALLCSFIIVFSVVLTGCGSVKKITQKKSTGSSDEIQIGENTDVLEGPTQIVVGDDGQSYIVDNSGHSVVYNSNQSGSSYSASSVTPNNSTAAKTNSTTKKITTATTKATTTKKTTTEATTATPSAVYNALAAQRKFGFNKLYDKGAQWVNFYLQTIRCYFTFNDKDWLIELWKGEYAMATVGCEVGFYNRDHNQALLDNPGPEWLHYSSVGDEDAMQVSMKLWQYEKSADSTPVQKIDYSKRLCWWAADFETGVLENHRDQTTLIMVATIDFTTDKMMNLFLDQLEAKGFTEGTINSYHNYDRYSVSGKTVTICWRNYNES